MKSALRTLVFFSGALVTLLPGCGGATQNAVTTSQPPQVSVSATPSSGAAPLNVKVTVTASDPNGTVASTTINFGDGSAPASGPSAQHTYSSAGTFTVQATATDNQGASTTATTPVNVGPHQPPVVSINLNPTSGPAPLTVSATVSDGAITGTTIDFGDGSALVNGTSASHTYTTAGTYTVTATATDDSGATASASQVVTVSAHVPPVVSLQVVPTSGIAPLAVKATMTATVSDGTIASTTIDFGDGSAVVSGTAASHTYATAGTYTVKATATDNFGASTSVTQTVTVSQNQPPVVSLKVAPTSGTTPLSVTATVTASDPDGTVASTTIDFGDGSATVSGTSATHTYLGAGTFTVKATATDNLGASTSATQTVTVTGNQPPVVSLKVSPTSGTAPLSVTATVTDSDPDGTIASTTIDFGDGSAAVSGTSATHTYTKAGTFTVKATATDNLGASTSATQTVTIINQPPVVSLQVVPTSGIAPLAVKATVTDSDPDGTIASTTIDFGDGSAAVSGTSASHTYTTAGTYTVKATATDNLGASTSATQTVTVSQNQPPVVSLNVVPTSGTAPLSVTATVTDSDPDGTIASTIIDFGDGSATVSGTSATHTYSTAGTYTVKATATDNLGASTSATVAVTVQGAGKTYYIDPSLSSNSCTTYTVSTRACGSGTNTAYKTPVLFSNAVTPGAGDVIYLRGGTYSTQLIITASGTATSPITYTNYGTETPTFSGSPSNTWFDDGSAPFATASVHSDGQTIMLKGASYVVVQGLTISNTRGIGHCHECSHVTIQNNTFQENCTGYHACASPTIQGEESSIGFWGGSYNSLLSNTISGAFDNIMIVESDHNLIRGNSSTNGAHTTLSVQCSNYTIVKGNQMSSIWEHLVENLDCEGGYSGQPTIYDDTHHNFFEKNIFSGTPSSTDDYAYNAMQWCGQDGVARLNDVYNNLGGGIHIQVYTNECTTVYHNRAYQNTVVSNNCWGLLSPNDDTNPNYNIFINNLLYLNTGGTSNTSCSTSDPTQLIIRSPSTAKSIQNLSATSDPGFTDVTDHVYTLVAGSQAIDYGTWLTTTTSAGSGTVIPVADAAYFRDSFGITGEQGDLIQLQGQTQTARIVSIDYTANTITVDTALTWTSGLGVALAYDGAAPDAGAHEY